MLVRRDQGDIVAAVDRPADQFQLGIAIDVKIGDRIVGDRGIELSILDVLHGVGVAVVANELDLVVFLIVQLGQAIVGLGAA